jgi:hypothetical protein
MANEFVAKNGLISQNNTIVSGSLTVSAPSDIPLQIKGGTGTLLSVSSSTTEIFKISDTFSPNLFTVSTGSTAVFNIDNTNKVIISGSLVVTGGITGSLLGTASFATTASYINPTFISASAAASGFGSGGTTINTSSFATTGSNTFTGTQTITGSSNSLVIRTGASTAITQQTTDFGGGSAGSNIGFGLAAATGNTHGTLTVRNTGGSSNGNLAIQSAGGNVAIGKTTFNAVLDVNGNVIITGSLNVSAGITGSLAGTATTASYISPTFISASAAASGFGSGGGGGITSISAGAGITVNGGVGPVTSGGVTIANTAGASGVTSITAGDGIFVNQTNGDVVITNTGGSGGISQGKVVAIATGISNLF